MHARAQGSVEYLAIIALGLAILLPLALWGSDMLARGSLVPQAEVAARRIAAAADLVAAQGPGAAATVDVVLPSNIDTDPARTYASGRVIQFTITYGSERTEAFAVTRANLTGTLPVTPGRHFVRALVLANGTVSLAPPT